MHLATDRRRLAQQALIAAPVRWVGFDFPPEPVVRLEDANGLRLDVPVAAALADGLLELPTATPDRAAYLRDWVGSLALHEVNHG